MDQKLIQKLPKHNNRSKFTSSELAAVWALEDMYSEYEYGEREKDKDYDTVMSYFDESGEFKAR